MITFDMLLKTPALETLTVIAGQDGLGHEVRVISVMDAPDSYKWLRGGEFILTSAYLFGGDARFLELNLMNLIEAGSSGLGIKKNRYLRKIPENIISIANQYRFPIIEIPYDFGWSDIINVFYELLYGLTENTHTAIGSEQMEKPYDMDHLNMDHLNMDHLNLDHLNADHLNAKHFICQKFIRDLISGNITPNEIHEFEKSRGSDKKPYTGVLLIHYSTDAITVYRKLLETTNKARVAKKGRANSYIVDNAEEHEAAVMLELHVNDDDALNEWQHVFHEDLEYRIYGLLGDYVSVGRLYPRLEDVLTSYREAKEAYAIGRALWNDRRCYPYSMLSVYSMLQNADPSRIDFSYIEALGNQQIGASLDGISTLEAYIECGSHKEAAERLYIHENTLRYRMQKITDYLHLDLDDPIVTQSLITQIKLWKLKKGTNKIYKN